MSTKSKEIPANAYSCNGKLLTFGKPLVMAIVNLTPDSFYDGGKFSGNSDVLKDVEEKLAAGADIIDLGPASSRPGSQPLTADEEWQRLSGPLDDIRRNFPRAVISIDTWHPEVARRAAGMGADMINDISGGDLNPGMFSAICELDLPYVIMHMEGTPATMQQNKPYPQVVNTVADQLSAKCERLEQMGFRKIIVDPGFGFGKSLENNFELLKGLQSLAALGYPILAGLSRKSMIGKVTGANPVTSLNGTTVLNTIALLNGASILRVHDVAEARQVTALIEFYRKVS